MQHYHATYSTKGYTKGFLLVSIEDLQTSSTAKAKTVLAKSLVHALIIPIWPTIKAASYFKSQNHVGVSLKLIDSEIPHLSTIVHFWMHNAFQLFSPIWAKPLKCSCQACRFRIEWQLLQFFLPIQGRSYSYFRLVRPLHALCVHKLGGLGACSPRKILALWDSFWGHVSKMLLESPHL